MAYSFRVYNHHGEEHGSRQALHGNSSWQLKLGSINKGWRANWELHGLLKPQGLPQWYTSSNKAIPPNPFQTVLPMREQAFKHTSLWGHSHSNNHTHSPIHRNNSYFSYRKSMKQKLSNLGRARGEIQIKESVAKAMTKVDGVPKATSRFHVGKIGTQL